MPDSAFPAKLHFFRFVLFRQPLMPKIGGVAVLWPHHFLFYFSLCFFNLRPAFVVSFFRIVDEKFVGLLFRNFWPVFFLWIIRLQGGGLFGTYAAIILLL